MKSLIPLLILAVSTSAFAFAPSAEDLAAAKRAEGKCYKNVHVVAPGQIKGDWVCGPPRAATPEEEQSPTET